MWVPLILLFHYHLITIDYTQIIKERVCSSLQLIYCPNMLYVAVQRLYVLLKLNCLSTLYWKKETHTHSAVASNLDNDI